MHIHVPFTMYCSRLFVVVFQERIGYTLLNMMLFVGSPSFIFPPSFISPPSFMFVSAVAVSEIHELNKNKKKEKEKNSKIGYFQFNTFPGHIIYPLFNQRHLLSTCMHLIC